MTRSRGIVVVCVPLVIGGLAGLLVRLFRPSTTLSASVAVWLLVLEFTVVIGVLTAFVMWMQAVRARAVATATREAREHGAEQAQTDRRRFVSRLDHELKNPLTAIRAGITNLSAGYEPEAKAQELIAALESQVMRLVRITGDLRKLTAVETAPLDLGPITPTSLLSEVVDDANEAARAQRPVVDVVLQLPRRPWPLPTLFGDQDLLHLALLNVVTNAVKFTPHGGVVTINARDDATDNHSGWLVIEVSDQGIGIAEDEVSQIWDELARGRSAHGLPGSGIGLAMVRTIVARHHGDVQVRSVEGSGTVVTVRLPFQIRQTSSELGADVADPVHP